MDLHKNVKEKMDPVGTKRVLIFHLGSLGDTVVALPAFHLIARAFSNAERWVLTHFPVKPEAPSIESILGRGGLVHDYMAYPAGTRSVREMLLLMVNIRRLRPEVLVYLLPDRGMLNVLRNCLYFRLCGIKTIIGASYAKRQRESLWLDDIQQYESESSRLARCLSVLGDAELTKSASWDLGLSDKEIGTADSCLGVLSRGKRLIACSVGTKMDSKDWGEDNWHELFKKMASGYPNYSVAFVGHANDHGRSERLRRIWPGRSVNLCGQLTPRESAAVLKRANVFIGHDSGPMHLAASVGVPCVAIFSARSKPGIWFPYGNAHRVLYHQTECYNCGLEVCAVYRKKCILSITVSEVFEAVEQVLNRTELNVAPTN